mgnify:CR=1 FL=1
MTVAEMKPDFRTAHNSKMQWCVPFSAGVGVWRWCVALSFSVAGWCCYLALRFSNSVAGHWSLDYVAPET